MTLTRDIPARECERLLRAAVLGRVAVSTPDGPHIVPVGYTVVDDTIAVRTSAYSILASYGPNAMLAFQVDEVDPEADTGWSVLARGRAWEERKPEEVARIRASWRGSSRAHDPSAMARAFFLRLRWSTLTGRRLGSGSGTRDESLIPRTLTLG